MTTREDFLSAIIANPDDDTPRLVMADWLEERGEGERAEFENSQTKQAFSRRSVALIILKRA